MKIIAYYLPQFHTFPENDRWWGKGFTEWTNVKNAKPIYKGHNQPRIPLGGNYYDLTDIETIKEQSRLAQKYGIYGFCYYHYWFNGKQIMEKPMELMLTEKEITLPFCISWANHDWTKAWAQKSKEMLMKQTYGQKDDWITHFNYLLPFFKDDRYIKINNKPIFLLYQPQNMPVLREMFTLWNELAQENGFSGLCYMYQHFQYNHLTDPNGDIFDYGIEYEPMYTKQRLLYTIPSLFHKFAHEAGKKIGLKPQLWNLIQYNYDRAWKDILSRSPRDEKMIPGAFVDWDNSPRYGKDAAFYPGYSAEKFSYYLKKQIINAREKYHKDMIFLFAWNEWGEGGYLEPDETEGYARLEAIKTALKEG